MGEFAQGSFGKFNYREPIGLRDRGHIILKCSSCGEALVDLWDAYDCAEKKKYRALCCFCGDKSFPLEAPANVILGGIGGEGEEGKTRVAVVDIEEEDNGLVIISTAKVNQ